MTDFTRNSSAYGLKLDEFGHLPPSTRRKITLMMSHVMERAYRRGAQHGAVGPIDHSENWWSDWRFDGDLNISVGIDGNKTTSIERLEMEEPIKAVGLGMD